MFKSFYFITRLPVSGCADLFERKGYVEDGEYDWTGRTMSTPVNNVSTEQLYSSAGKTFTSCAGPEHGPDLPERPRPAQHRQGGQGDPGLEREQA